jgi:hypothetical protein
VTGDTPQHYTASLPAFQGERELQKIGLTSDERLIEQDAIHHNGHGWGKYYLQRRKGQTSIKVNLPVLCKLKT